MLPLMVISLEKPGVMLMSLFVFRDQFHLNASAYAYSCAVSGNQAYSYCFEQFLPPLPS